MDEPKIAFPDWLPWATTAVLAALVACAGEKLMIERTRAQLLRDEIALSAAALQASDNQLAVEKIVSRREIDQLRSGFRVVILAPVPGSPSDVSGSAFGAVVWSPYSKRGLLTLRRLPPRAPGGSYQLWLLDDGAGPPGNLTSCAVFPAPEDGGGPGIAVDIAAPLAKGPRFLLVYGKRGGATNLQEYASPGSIVLASLPR